MSMPRTSAIVGSYKQHHSGMTHAVIRNGVNSPYRTLCGTHPKLHICGPPRDVDCKKCLRKLGKQKPQATEMNNKPKQKGFFLVTFDDADIEMYNSLAKLQDKIKQYKEEMIKVQIVDSYRTVYMKTVLVDEDGKEITEQSL